MKHSVGDASDAAPAPERRRNKVGHAVTTDVEPPQRSISQQLERKREAEDLLSRWQRTCLLCAAGPGAQDTHANKEGIAALVSDAVEPEVQRLERRVVLQ